MLLLYCTIAVLNAQIYPSDLYGAGLARTSPIGQDLPENGAPGNARCGQHQHKIANLTPDLADVEAVQRKVDGRKRARRVGRVATLQRGPRVRGRRARGESSYCKHFSVTKCAGGENIRRGPWRREGTRAVAQAGWRERARAGGECTERCEQQQGGGGHGRSRGQSRSVDRRGQLDLFCSDLDAADDT